MIEAWRNVWHMRSGSITDPAFPFGFVQVRKSFFITSFPTLSSLVVNK
jgi:hypothetical protein